MKLFCRAPLCFELEASNRFKEPLLRDLMAFMRSPGKSVPIALKAAWESRAVKDNDPRLAEERFQKGHMIGTYWDTVARWMVMRAKRDARSLRTPLICIQAADESVPVMPIDVAQKS